MKLQQDLVIVNRVQELYNQLGFAVPYLDEKSEFTIYNLGDFPFPKPFMGPKYRTNFFSFIFAKQAKGATISDHYRFDIEPGTVYFQ